MTSISSAFQGALTALVLGVISPLSDCRLDLILRSVLSHEMLLLVTSPIQEVGLFLSMQGMSPFRWARSLSRISPLPTYIHLLLKIPYTPIWFVRSLSTVSFVKGRTSLLSNGIEALLQYNPVSLENKLLLETPIYLLTKILKDCKIKEGLSLLISLSRSMGTSLITFHRSKFPVMRDAFFRAASYQPYFRHVTPKVNKAIDGYAEGDQRSIHFFQANAELACTLFDPHVEHISKIGIRILGKEKTGIDNTGRDIYKYQLWWITW